MWPETPSYTQISTDVLPLSAVLRVALESIYSQGHRFSCRTEGAVEAYLILNPYNIIYDIQKKVHSSPKSWLFCKEIVM